MALSEAVGASVEAALLYPAKNESEGASPGASEKVAQVSPASPIP